MVIKAKNHLINYTQSVHHMHDSMMAAFKTESRLIIGTIKFLISKENT